MATLQEKDIPGSSLNGRNPSELKVPELKRWLACQGTPQKGKKADLVARFVKILNSVRLFKGININCLCQSIRHFIDVCNRFVYFETIMPIGFEFILRMGGQTVLLIQMELLQELILHQAT